MILLHKSLKRSEDLIKSIRYNIDNNCNTLSGIIECFKNQKIQVYILKIFHSFNRDNDLAIWLYESIGDKYIGVAYSTLSNVDKYNNWINQEKVNIKRYLIVTEIKRNIKTLSKAYHLFC